MKGTGIVVSMVLLALLAAGCGGDDGEDTAAQETAAEEDFAAQATDICARVSEELSQIQNFPQEGPPVIEEGLADLGGLTPPPGEEETFDRFIQEGQDAVREIETAEQPPQQDPFAEFTRLGEQLGIEGGCTGAGQPES